MEKTIQLKVKKELTLEQEKQVIRLKGALIAKGFTDIIHISDEGEEFHINQFIILPNKKDEALDFIKIYLIEKGLISTIWIL